MTDRFFIDDQEITAREFNDLANTNEYRIDYEDGKLILRKDWSVEVFKLKQMLTDTDYQAIKFAEGELTEEEFAPIKAQRKEWRAEINRLQEEYNI